MNDLNFILTSLIVVLLPGTGVIFTISTGLSQGRQASFWAALGCTLGIVPHLLTTVLGLAALLHTSAIAYQSLKYAGVAYLIYLAISNLRNKSLLQSETSTETKKRLEIVTKAILINVLNPKLTIFFLAFLPQFVPASSPSPMTQLLALSSVFMLMTFAVFIVYGLLANALRTKVIQSPTVQTWLKRAFAGVFVALSAKLAFSEN